MANAQPDGVMVWQQLLEIPPHWNTCPVIIDIKMRLLIIIPDLNIYVHKGFVLS